MDISTIDKNFDVTFAVPNDVEWLSVEEDLFSISIKQEDRNEII